MPIQAPATQKTDFKTPDVAKSAEPAKAPIVPKQSSAETPKDTPATETFDLKSLTIEKPKQQPKTPEIELFDAVDAVIAPGTICKRPACGKSYVDESSRQEECVFHAGTPVFHEGSKGFFIG